MPAPKHSEPWKGARARDELLAIYRDVDALLAPHSCDASTECCRFGITGREPYPTAVELEELELGLRAIGGLRSGGARDARGRGKRALPVLAVAGERAGRSADAPEEPAEKRCPVLSDEGTCRAYAARPFGCRTFFCERRAGPKKLPRDAIQELSRRLADLSARAFPRDPGPRPLTRALAKEKNSR